MNTNITATLLTEEQSFGLDIFAEIGTKVGGSDLAVLLGMILGSQNKTKDGQRSGTVWSASSVGYGHVRYVRDDGARDGCRPYERLLAARPALPSSVASSIRPSEARLTRKISVVDVVEFGEYPQTIANETITRELEQAFSKGKLQATGKTYTFDGQKNDAYDTPFSAESHSEYRHNGKRYIRVEAKPFDSDSILSNGEKPKAGEAYWVEVQPIEWLVDKKTGIWVARQALFAGIQFDTQKKYDGNFENTWMNQYLQTYFVKEMQVGKAVKKTSSFVDKVQKPQNTITPVPESLAALKDYLDNASKNAAKKPELFMAQIEVLKQQQKLFIGKKHENSELGQLFHRALGDYTEAGGEMIRDTLLLQAEKQKRLKEAQNKLLSIAETQDKASKLQEAQDKETKLSAKKQGGWISIKVGGWKFGL